MSRLSASADYCDFPFDSALIRQQMETVAQDFIASQHYRVRLTLDHSGNVEIESNEFSPATDETPTVMISPVRTSAGDRFLYHKTSKRTLYDTSYKTAKAMGFSEVIFMNEQGQITEGSRTNLFILKNNIYRTPPVTCGLLDGIYRQYMLETVQNVQEAILTPQDLQDADAVFICNSLRGCSQVRFTTSHVHNTSSASIEKA
jgi:para-aminobenzoate synthetase/4-amino-4-deoxychorismate lyase